MKPLSRNLGIRPLARPLFLLLACMSPLSSVSCPRTRPATLREELRAQHQLVIAALNVKDDKGRLISLDDPRVPPLLKRGWTLAGKWAADFLNSHPNPSPAELQSIFEGFAPEPHQEKSPYEDFLESTEYGFSGSATRISDSLFVMEARYFADDFATGTFFVVARNPRGQFEALWNVKDLAESHYPKRDEIGRWLHLTRRAYYNGPLSVDQILPLPELANGHQRFLVKASQGADGGTVLYQLSIWEWNGSEAVPLLVDAYEQSLGSGEFRFDGKTIHVPTKERLETLFSCGGCAEPQGSWEIRLTPSGVQNLGHHLLQPEYKWADDLLTKIAKGESTASLAAPKVEKDVRAYIAESQAELDQRVQNGQKLDFSWGMMGSLEVIRRGRSTGSFRLSTDEATIRFDYLLRRGKPYFTHVGFE